MRVVSLLLILGAGVLFIQAFEEPDQVVIDHLNYQHAIDGMREGSSYYAAYEKGFRQVYGPVPSFRDFRPPTLYALLALFPPGSEFIAYAVMAMLAGTAIVFLGRFPLTGVLVSVYLLRLAVPVTPSGPAAQYLYAEAWVAPFVIVAVYMLKRERIVAAMTASVVAFSIREQALLLVVGVAAWLWFRQRHRAVAVIGVVISTLGYALHVAGTLAYLDPVGGVHTPLHLGWDPLVSLGRTLGMGLGAPWVGVVFVGLAFLWARRHGLLWAVAPYLALPLLNLWANRPYWGVMVLPVAMCLAVDVVDERLTYRPGLDRLPAGQSAQK